MSSNHRNHEPKKSKENNNEKNPNKNEFNIITNIFNNLEKDGLEIKETAFENSREEFIKGKEFEKIISKNYNKYLEIFQKDFPYENFTQKNNQKDINYFLNQIYFLFNKNLMMIKAIREEGDKKKNIKRLLPYELLVKEYHCLCARDHQNIERDHNMHFSLEEMKKFNKELYYIIDRKKSHKWSYFYLGLIIFGILMYMLMPIWPYNVKLGVWWVSYILLIVTAVLLGIRYLIYALFFIIGYDAWLFPDLNDPKLGVLDSFKRVFTIEKRNEQWYTILIRVIISIIIGYIAFCFYRRPGLYKDIKKIVYEALKDIYFYGEDKLVKGNTTSIRVKYRTIEEIDDII
jgi:translocation protein SEC62